MRQMLIDIEAHRNTSQKNKKYYINPNKPLNKIAVSIEVTFLFCQNFAIIKHHMERACA